MFTCYYSCTALAVGLVLRRTTEPAITHILRSKPYTLNAGDPCYTITIPKEALENNPGLKD